MSADTPSKRELTQLNLKIEQAEAELARLKSERAAIFNDKKRAARRFRYLRFLQRLRSPAAKFPQWPIGVVLFGSMFVGIFVLTVVQLLTGSYPLAFFGFLVGTVAGVGLFATLLYYPADTQLPVAIADAEAKSRLENARLTEKNERLSEVGQLLQRLLDERRDQVATGKLQRAALLQRNWKSMRDTEWDDFVVEVCRTLGATVERNERAGAEGAHLIADFGNRRAIVFTRGEGHNVSSETIQQAIAAKDRYGCNQCAVVINRRFTGAAQDFARHNGCSAIGAGEFPDFVMGKIEL